MNQLMTASMAWRLRLRGWSIGGKNAVYADQRVATIAARQEDLFAELKALDQELKLLAQAEGFVENSDDCS